MPGNSELKTLDAHHREAFVTIMEIFDELSDGAFRKGYRTASAPERVTEWDNLTPDDYARLVELKGEEWVRLQGAEIERLRKKVRV